MSQDNTVNPEPTEQQIADLDEKLKDHFQQYEKDCYERTKTIKSIVGTGWFTERELYLKSQRNIMPTHILPILQRIGLVEHQSTMLSASKTESRWRVCLNANIRQRYFEKRRKDILQELSDLNYAEIAMKANDKLEDHQPQTKEPTLPPLEAGDTLQVVHKGEI